MFGQYRGPKVPLSLTKCTPRTMYVDANVTCISRSTLSKAICGVGTLRETPDPPAAPNMTVFDWSLFSKSKSGSFADTLIGGLSFGQASSDAEYYISDPLTAFTAPRVGNTAWTDPTRFEFADLGSLDIAIFERRFSLLCNTLWKSAWLKQSAMGGNIYSIDPQKGTLSDMVRNTTSIVTFPLPPTYETSMPWLVVYFIAVAVMLLAAIFSLVIRSLCGAPAILGYVSSLTRDSSYFKDFRMYKNSTEDEPARTKRLGRLKVMIADVGSGTDGVGKIAFAPVGVGERIRKRRSYI